MNPDDVEFDSSEKFAIKVAEMIIASQKTEE